MITSMMTKIQKKLALFLALLMSMGQFSMMIPMASAAGNASLSFGNASLRNGCPGSIAINLNTGGESVWAADVTMALQGAATIDSLELGSTFPLQACNDPATPEFMLCGARQPGSTSYNGQAVYGTIHLTPTSAGALSLNFDESETNIIDDAILDVLGQTAGATYTVAERFDVDIDGVGFCEPDTTAPTIGVLPYNGQNNIPVDTSITLNFSDDRVGVDLSTLSFSVNNENIDTSNFTEMGGIYTPATPFALGEQVTVNAEICDKNANCRQYSGHFRVTPPPPAPNCGDQKVDEGEECDDGYQTANCDRDCTLVECGDGIINDVAGEQCDDFNVISGDGCSAICTLEAPVEDQTYCPVIETPETLTCPECPVVIAEEDEDEIVPPEPDIEYSEEEITEKAVQVVAKEKVLETAPLTILVPEQEAASVSQIDECKEAFPGLDFLSDSADADQDGLSNKTECYGGTSPILPDTDGDGCTDGEEINQYASNPIDGFDCQIATKQKTISISSPQAGWLLAELEISGLTPSNTSLVHLLAFPTPKKGSFQLTDSNREEGIELGTVRRFSLSDVEGQYHFKLIPELELENSTSYSLVAIGILEDGSIISSQPIKITMDTLNAAQPPTPISIGNVPITDEPGLTRIRIKSSEDGRVKVTGETEYGSQVFAVWESVVLASSVIADSQLGEFSIESPRALKSGEDHEVTLFTLKKSGDQKLKSKNVSVPFHIEKTNYLPYILGVLAGSLLVLIYVLKKRSDRLKNKKTFALKS